MKELYSFNDYRDYLSFMFNEKKKKSKAFSYQYCANRLGTSRAYLKLVIDKKRHITLEKIINICSLFELNRLEQEYFLILFLENISTEVEVKKLLQRILMQIKFSSERDIDYKLNTSEVNQLQLFQNWLKLALHSIVRLEDFEEDGTWIHQKLNSPEDLTEEDILTTLKGMLEESSLVRRDNKLYPDGFVKATPSGFDQNPFEVYKIGLNKALSAIDNIDQHRPRNFNMLFLALSDREIEMLHQKLFELRDFAIELSKSSEKKEKVVMLNANFLTLTK